MSSAAEISEHVRPALVRAMARRIDGHVIRTPTLPSEDLTRITGARIFFKYESLQHTGAFKARGAAARLLGFDRQKTCGVAAMSAGNHAQGVAFFCDRGRPSVVRRDASTYALSEGATRTTVRCNSRTER